MKTPFAKVLLAVVAIIAFSCEQRFVVGTRLPTPTYTRPMMPGDAYIWIEGEWFWNGNGYLWRNGYWSLPARGYRWEPGRWTPRGHGYHWKAGRWR